MKMLLQRWVLPQEPIDIIIMIPYNVANWCDNQTQRYNE